MLFHLLQFFINTLDGFQTLLSQLITSPSATIYWLSQRHNSNFTNLHKLIALIQKVDVAVDGAHKPIHIIIRHAILSLQLLNNPIQRLKTKMTTQPEPAS